MLRSWSHFPDIFHELHPVRVTREPINCLDTHIDFHGLCLPAACIQGYFLPAFLDAPSQSPFCLVAYKNHGVLFFWTISLEVFHHRTAVEHTRGSQNDARLAVIDDFLSLLLGIHLHKTFRKEWIHALMENLVPKLIVQVFGMRGMDCSCLINHPVKVNRDVV